MPPRKQEPPAAPAPIELVLHCASFVAAERAEVQVHFDTAFGDLVQYLRDYLSGEREGPMTTAIVTREGARWFPDQIMAYMLWVEARRTDPDAQLEDYAELSEYALRAAAVRGFMGKAGTPSTRQRTSGPVPGSSGSSAVA